MTVQAHICGGRIQQLEVKKVQQGSEGKSDFLPSKSRPLYGLRPTVFELSKSTHWGYNLFYKEESALHAVTEAFH